MFQKVIYNKQNAQAIISGKKDTIYTNVPNNVISSMEKAFKKMTRGKYNIMLRMIYSHLVEELYMYFFVYCSLYCLHQDYISLRVRKQKGLKAQMTFLEFYLTKKPKNLVIEGKSSVLVKYQLKKNKKHFSRTLIAQQTSNHYCLK